MKFAEPWTRPQRGVLIGLLGLAGVYLIIRFVLYPTYIPDPQPEHPARENELANRIDPNTADVPTLAALPLIGDKRAQDIINYRQRFQADHPGSIAFSTLTDLRNIRGIGTVTLQQLDPFLIFPGQVPATLPSIPK